MATPAQLCAAIAESLAMPEVTVSGHYRYLREAGLTTKGGRGRGAPKMTATDAANLILAILGSSSIKEAPATVEALRGAQVDSVQLNGQPSNERRPPIPVFRRLPRNHTLGEMIDGLMEAFAGGEVVRVEPGQPFTAIDFAITRTAVWWQVDFMFQVGRNDKWRVRYARFRPEFDGVSSRRQRLAVADSLIGSAARRSTIEVVDHFLFVDIASCLAGRGRQVREDDA